MWMYFNRSTARPSACPPRLQAAIGLLITPIFSKITKFFPPLVTGIVITTIGLTLMPVAARWAMGGNSSAADFGSMANIGLAGLTFAIVLLLSKLGSATISRLSILLAMVVGTEAMLALKDVLQLDDTEARRVRRWAIRALVDAARKPATAT